MAANNKRDQTTDVISTNDNGSNNTYDNKKSREINSHV